MHQNSHLATSKTTNQLSTTAKMPPTIAHYITPIIFESSSGWNTYLSVDYSFSVQYPPDWEVIQTVSTLEPSIEIHALKSSHINETIDFVAVKRVVYESVEEYIAEDQISVDKTMTTFDGLSAVMGVVPGSKSVGGSMIELFVAIDKKGYLIVQNFPGLYNKNKLDQFPKPYPDILSTVKFSQTR